jgi:hypothetical protein
MQGARWRPWAAPDTVPRGPGIGDLTESACIGTDGASELAATTAQRPPAGTRAPCSEVEAGVREGGLCAFVAASSLASDASGSGLTRRAGATAGERRKERHGRCASRPESARLRIPRSHANDFPLFRSLLVIFLFIAVVGMAGSWATGDGAPWAWRVAAGGRADRPRDAAVAAALPTPPAAARTDTAAQPGCAAWWPAPSRCRTRCTSPAAWRPRGGRCGRTTTPATPCSSRWRGRRAARPGAGDRRAVTDWEDVAAGPCPGGRCLYVADIGDNTASRPSVTVYRVPEPRPGEPARAPARRWSPRTRTGRRTPRRSS